MGFEIKGYVTEPIRVGQSNGTFTQTPDNYIYDQIAFDAAYPADESAPRTEYLILVTQEGGTRPGFLESAQFGWTKNEVIDRFGYDAKAGSFKPLPGAIPAVVGSLSLTSNTTRLRVRAPAQTTLIPDAPLRISVGSSGSGVTFPISIVLTEAGFTIPALGTVQIAQDTGTLNWHPTDLTTFSGQIVRFQQQQFYDYKDSTGRLGFPSNNLMLSPIPGSGQSPLIRFGYGVYLSTIQVPDEGSFSGDPTTGTVEWALATGRLKFHSNDITSNSSRAVYYDGVLFVTDAQLPALNLGTVSIGLPMPTVIPPSTLPPIGADLIFAAIDASPYYRFPQLSFVTSFSAGQSGVIQVNRTTGQVQLSSSDQSKYNGNTVTYYSGDLPIERGVAVRLFRTPVNLDGANTSIKDVAQLYSVEGASFADPIIASPQVFLPSTPYEASPLTIRVLQGQGSFTSDDLPDLAQVNTPGLGYFIDFDSDTLYFAQRIDQQILPVLQLTSDVAVQPLLLPNSALFEKETAPGSGIYVPLVSGNDILIDDTSGVASLVVTNEVVAEGTASLAATTMLDTNGQFLTTVMTGQTLVVLDSAAKGAYTIASVLSNTLLAIDTPAVSVSGAAYQIYESGEILADRYFAPVDLVDPSTSVSRINSLGAASNAPRLSVPVAYSNVSGFRLGPTDFATVVLVANDGLFTSPLAGIVELSVSTGNLNFSTTDLGATVYWSRTLVSGKDYQLAAGLGQVQFAENLLAREEVLVTYRTEPPSTTPPTVLGSPIQEYARFLIRKELTADHPSPTSTLQFNTAALGDPHPLAVASTPAPSVFRGGRPQRLGAQCSVDPTTSTITFQEDGILTNALPHGAIIAPTERVYIDYYVTQAVGGEKSFTVLNPPIHVVTVTITEGTNSFTVPGDHTTDFSTGYLLRVELEQVYLIGNSTYDSGTNLTTVTLEGSQEFQDTFNAPQLYVSSGSIPVSGPNDYFELETSNFEAIARGSTTILIAGDVTKTYLPGTVIYVTDSGETFRDFLVVSATELDADNGRTKVMLTAGATRQYVQGSQFLSHSVRPVYEVGTVEFRTLREPVLTQPYQVYRRVAGDTGELLESPTDYTIDPTGCIVFSEALIPGESFVILYTGRTVLSAGITLRASYTHQITPDSLNGLLGQQLLADYTVRSPDTFFYRVETMTNFRGEYAAEIASAASSGSSGPPTSNVSQPSLFEQGRKGLYFDERHFANQDVIARSTLLFYNDLVNLLEDYRQAITGDVVGNNDGQLLFDGTQGNVAPPVGNQIDDLVKISNSPYSISGPPFTVTSIGTYRTYYVASPLSRFYPTVKNFFGVSAVSGTTEEGEEVVDTGSTNVTGVSNVRTRQAWAVVTESSLYSGSTVLNVDDANGATEYVRPGFANGMKVVVQNQDGTVVSVGGTTVSSFSPTQVILSASLTGVAEVGATIYQDPTDTLAPYTLHVFGRDYGLNGELGQLTYVATASGNKPILSNEPISGSLTLTNSLTSPLQIPALFGGIEDDDGELSFPIQTPSPDSEGGGYLVTEDLLIRPTTGLIRTSTTASFEVGTGSVAVLGNSFTITGTAPSPTMQQYDLIRIKSGVNADLTHYRKVLNSGPFNVGSTVNLGGPALSVGSFSYEAVVSNTVVSGVVPVSPSSTTTTVHTTTSFSGARVGHTLVFTSGGNTGVRTQITSVGGTSVTVSPALPSAPVSPASFRVVRSLSSYGGAGISHYVAELSAALTGIASLYPSEQSTLSDTLDQVFTDVTTGTTAMTATAIFVDGGGDFTAVLPTDYLYIPAGLNAGFYSIQSVDSTTQLTLTSVLPAATTSAYRIVSLFGMSKDSVLILFSLRQAIQALLTATTTFQALINTIPVYETGGSSLVGTAFATGLITSALDSRSTAVSARLADLTTIEQQLTDILSNTDKLYDKRYVWIDTRINLEDGLLVQQTRAVVDRIKAQADILKQLTKLLAVEGT